jgi:hypothetical protein
VYADSKAFGAIVYDFGPGRRDEHVNPRFVAGNVPGLPLQVARMIDHVAKARPDITNPIWRCSLSLPEKLCHILFSQVMGRGNGG